MTIATALWCVIALCLGTACLGYVNRLRAEAEEAAYARAEAITLIAEQSWRATFETVRNGLQLQLLRQRMIDYGGETSATAVELTLNEIARARYQGITTFSVADMAGRITWSTTRRVIGRDISQQHAFTALFDGSGRARYISRPRRGTGSGEWRVEISRPIPDAHGGVLGVAIVTVDPLVLSRALAGLLPGPSHVITIHRRADGTLRAISRDPEQRLGQPPIPDHPVTMAARQAPAGRLVFPSMTDDQPLLVAYRVTGALDMVVATHIERRAALAEAERASAIAMAATGLLLLAILAILLALAHAAALRDRLRDQALRDPLTGLHNRRAMEHQLPPMLDQHRRAGLALLLFDLDHFKRINDQHGHAAGDTVLRDVAAVLRGAVRGRDLVCRWGGEELLVVLADCPIGHARTRADQLREAIALCYSHGQGPVPRVTASVGVACFPRDGAVLEALLEVADRALYSAKSAGRNRVALVAEAV